MNSAAYQLSRTFSYNLEWSLKTNVFQQITKLTFVQILNGQILNVKHFLHLVRYPSFDENFSGQSVRVTDRTCVDDSKLVPTPSSTAHRQTNFTTAERQSLVPASQSNPPSHEGSSSSGRVEVMWKSLGNRGFSDETAHLITSS